MNRRSLIQFSLMAALAPSTQLHAATKEAKTSKTAEDGGSAKKGLGHGMGAPDWSDKLQMVLFMDRENPRLIT